MAGIAFPAADEPREPSVRQAPSGATVPIYRYRVVVSTLVAAVALFAFVFALSPFNPLRAMPRSDSAPAIPSDIHALDQSESAYESAYDSAYANDEVAISEQDASVLGQIVIDGTPISEASIAYVASSQQPFTSQVGTLSQSAIGLPSGCEIVSLALLLQSLGCDVDPETLADQYLVMDGAFSTGYAGSPYGAGGGFPPGIVKAANAYLLASGSAYHAYDLTGTSFEGLKGLMAHGYPVLVWSTMYFAEPMFSGTYENDRQWYNNEHCIVAYSADNGVVSVSDPIEGYVVRDEAEFARIYEECGSMAAVVL